MEKSDIFDSSDALRGAFDLPFAKRITFPGTLKLERGGKLEDITVLYETYGTLNESKSNAILICHALTGDSHVARHNPQDHPGWWDILVGPGKSIDTNRYFVICANTLGSCRGTTGPTSINPKTGKPYGPDFPVVTMEDNVHVQKMLMDHLGIPKLLAVVGGSVGGMMAIIWSVRYPDALHGAVTLATSPRLTSQALAFHIVGRNAITSDPDFAGGNYYDKKPPKVGLALARMLGHITYLSRESMMRKFDVDRDAARQIDTKFETKYSVGSYLAYQGARFNDRFDANSYLALTQACDLMDFGNTVDELAERLDAAKCRWLVMCFSSDWLFPSFQSEMIVDALIARKKRVSYCEIQSDCGHDAFLLPHQLSTYGGLTETFIGNLYDEFCKTKTSENVKDSGVHKPEITQEKIDTSAAAIPMTENGSRENLSYTESEKISEDTWAFSDDAPDSLHGRLDFETILGLIPRHASVLDLGCGNGDLLLRLRQRSNKSRLLGVENSERAIQKCVARGLDVIYKDLNHGLANFHDRQFEYVVMSQTLQTIMDVEQLVEEMLRVGHRGIVSFPNAAYLPWRKQLYYEGRMPEISCDDRSRWYETQNVRFLTIADFHAYCDRKGYSIMQQIALNTQTGTKVMERPNDNATMAIMVLSR
ncbi:MAG: homoserine O-acetyltransferase [Planctomycetia bacterium]|nr:homoserine O-acetyltransferase [Planctomycetia bacterium]